MIKVTRAMINAAYEVTLANHEIALSASMLTKIYTAMNEVAERDIAAAEREACAKIADGFTVPMCDSSADAIAALIRARGQQ